MEKVDFKRTLDCYRAKPGEFRVVDVPPLQYLMIDGRGDPNTAPAFTRAVAALYPLAYALQFASKRELGRDAVVMPLEGLWSAGTCVQTLHVGAFDDEGPVLAELHHRFIPVHGLRETGQHHEIYLSDARRVEPANRRTILRQPVVPAS